MIKRILALVLAAALCLGLAGCGKEQIGSYTVLETIGKKEYAALYRSNDVISGVVEAAIQSLASTGGLGRLSATWLGGNYIELEGDPNAFSEVEMPADRVLIIGVDTDAPPFAYTSNGSPAGLFVDIARAIGTVVGWEVKIISVKSADISAQLSSGNIDCALGFSPSCIDPAKYSVGTLFMESEIVVAVPEGSEVKTLRRIRGERIGTISDPALEDAITSHDKLSKFSGGATVYVTPPRCISALDNGWCVAMVMDVLMLRAYAGNYITMEMDT